MEFGEHNERLAAHVVQARARVRMQFSKKKNSKNHLNGFNSMTFSIHVISHVLTLTLCFMSAGFSLLGLQA